jgi:hypothetical protein
MPSTDARSQPFGRPKGRIQPILIGLNYPLEATAVWRKDDAGRIERALGHIFSSFGRVAGHRMGASESCDHDNMCYALIQLA